MPTGTGWTRSGRLVLFQFDSDPDRLDLVLWVGPGPAEARRRLIDLVTAHQPPYAVPRRATIPNQSYKSIFSRRFLKAEDYQDAALGEIEARIRARWAEFVDRDLPALVGPIHEAASSIAASVADGEATNATISGLVTEAMQDR